MASELTPTTVDLTGLPEPVARSIRQLVESLREGTTKQPETPRLPLRGRFADLQLSIPKEDIDAAQREAWATFPRDFPEPGRVMNDVLADTHAVVWFLFDPPRLTPAADAALTAASQAGKVYVSAITLVELNYLSGRKTFPYTGVLPRLVALASDPNEPLEVLPLTLEIALAMDQVPKAEIPDMPDRIVAATAVAHKLPLVSADADILNSASLKALVPVIW